MGQSVKVLCVLAEDQKEEYTDEFKQLQRPGVDFIWRDDPDDVLVEIPVLGPDLIIVGMEIGPMEGLEFLALLMTQYKSFDKPLVVLPRKGDPFPPVVQRRDPSTGRSSTEDIDFQHIVTLLDRTRDEMPGEAAPASPRQLPLSAADDEPSPGAASLPAVALLAPEPASARRPAWLIVAVAMGSALILVLVLLLLWPRHEEPATVALSKKKITSPSSASAAQPRNEPVNKGEKKRPAVSQRPPPDKITSHRWPAVIKLPLRFDKGSAQPKISDQPRLKALLAQMRQHSQARFEIGGHTSGEGLDEYNLKLGRQRAIAAKRLLVSRGIAGPRLTIKSYGSRAPLAPSATEEGRGKNRRVELRTLP